MAVRVVEENGDKGGNRPFSKARQDSDDYNNELAGREVGRMHRFFSDHASPQGKARQEKEAREHTSLLLRLLQTTAYAALYHETMDKLTRAEVATEAALQDAETRLAGADRDLGEMRDRASTLSDGKKVFRAQDGHVYTEDGRRLSDDEREQVQWRKDAPGYEDYTARKKDAAKARADIDALRDYQVNVLGRIRDRMTDETNPPSKDEIEGFQKDIDRGLPATAAARISTDASPTVEATNSASALAPPPIGS